jgi:hypothetical protein
MGLLGYSSVLMGLVNLVAPFTIGLFRFSRKVVWRVGLIHWWFLYLFVSLWSASRGGLVAAFIWIFIYLLIWLVDKGGLKNVVRFWHLASLMQRVTLGAITLSGILIPLGLYGYVSSHPSHVGFLSGRPVFWRTAFEIWRAHPSLACGVQLAKRTS